MRRLIAERYQQDGIAERVFLGACRGARGQLQEFLGDRFGTIERGIWHTGIMRRIVQRSKRGVSGQSVLRSGGDAELPAARDVRRLEEYSDDGGSRLGPVSNPVAPALDPCPTRPGKLRVGPRRWQPGLWRSGDFQPSGRESVPQGARRLWAFAFFVIRTQRPDVLPRLGRQRNQRRVAVLRSVLPARFASMRAMLSSNSRNTSSPDTTCPAASSASLRASEARSSASLGIGGSRSGGCLGWGVSSIWGK